MSRIRSKDTLPEKLLRSGLHRMGYRFRKHVTTLPGKPDMVFKRYRAVVRANGCFWHLHTDCNYSSMPSTRRGFWKKKLEANADRDRRQTEALRRMRWRVLIVWECGLKPPSARARTIAAAGRWLKSGSRYRELPPARRGKAKPRADRKRRI